jgi:hypothetical protein
MRCSLEVKKAEKARKRQTRLVCFFGASSAEKSG